jgi:hypothetical protein
MSGGPSLSQERVRRDRGAFQEDAYRVRVHQQRVHHHQGAQEGRRRRSWHCAPLVEGESSATPSTLTLDLRLLWGTLGALSRGEPSALHTHSPIGSPCGREPHASTMGPRQAGRIRG